jgi:hypothetical protein
VRSGERRRLAWTALALLGACVDKTPFALVKNTCLTNAECAEVGAVCDSERLQCMRESVDEPYQVILQVTLPKPVSVELPEGESLVEQETYAAFELRGAIPDNVLEVPLSRQVTGRVVRLVDGEEQLVEAELKFVPEDQTVPVSMPTKKETSRIPGDAVNNFKVNLNPNVRYQVRVQPLLAHSRAIAPFTDNPTVDGNSDLVIKVPEEMARRSGVLRDERGAILRDHRIRLEDKQSGAILSTTATTGENGEFELYAPATVMAEQSFNVVISLDPFSLSDVKVAVDGSRLAPVPNLVLTIPRAPEPVVYQGGVEAKTSEEDKGTPAPYADLIFSSRFPVPVPSDGDDPRGTDWCAWRTVVPGPAPLCSARVAAKSDASGKFSVQLLPGVYDVFISPSSETGNSTALSTTKVPGTTRVLSLPPGTAFEGPNFKLGPAIHFDGLVRSPGGEPMPNVKVTARPLAIPGPTDDDDVYKYARPAAAITARNGTFELDVDRGYFDLIVEPPSESGFAWVHSLNRVVRGEPERPVGPLEPSVPVPVSGHVEHEGMPLPGATVEAFALIAAEPGGRRAVRIAQTVTDDAGAYRLALPPAVRGEDPDDAEIDAGHSE